jgi:hypothetical protein
MNYTLNTLIIAVVFLGTAFSSGAAVAYVSSKRVPKKHNA